MKVAAFFGVSAGTSPEQVVSAMLAAQALEPTGGGDVAAVPGGAIGWQHQGDAASRVPLVHRSREGNILVVTGVPTVSAGSVTTWLERVVAADAHGARRLLEEGEGAFACLHWHQPSGTLTVVGDILGLQPLHHAGLPGGVAFATDLRAFTGSGLVAVEMDPAGWGAFVAVGHMLGDSTQLASVRRLPPAASWQYVRGSLTPDRRTYWQWPVGERDSDPKAVVDALHRQCLSYAEYTDAAHILLSGGFDSRLIAFTLVRSGQRPVAIVHEHGDEDWGADSRFARRVAAAAGVRVIDFPTVRDFYSTDSYLTYLARTEVSVPSLNLFIAQAAQGLEDLGVEAVWEGWAPGSFLGPRVSSGGISDWYRLVNERRGAVHWQAASEVFAAETVTAMKDAFARELARTRAPFSDDKPGAYRFLALTRGRYRTGQNPLRAYASVCLPFMPGTSREFVAAATSLAENATTKLGSHGVVFRDVFPEHSTIPFSSNGKLLRLASSFDPEYYVCQVANRARKDHRLGRALSLVGFDVRSRRPRASDWVNGIVNAAHLDDPALNPDGVRALQQSRRESPVARAARDLLFYWSAWRLVLRGGPVQAFVEECRRITHGAGKVDA